MSDKIQMTEEQKDQLLNDMGISGSTDKDYYGEKLKNAGYIIKPEIEQAIEDAEKELSKEVRVHGKKYPVETAFMLLKKFYEEHK